MGRFSLFPAFEQTRWMAGGSTLTLVVAGQPVSVMTKEKWGLVTRAGRALSLSFFFFFVSLVIPQFGVLSQFSSLRLSSGHSGQVLTLRTDDAACASLPSPAPWCWTRASGLLLCWQLWLGVYSVGFFLFVCFFLSWLCCPLRFQNSPQTCL